MALDPFIRQMLIDLDAVNAPDPATLPVETLRQGVYARRARYGGPVQPVGRVDDVTIDGPGGPLALRLYTPLGAGPFPTLLYFHGGGWVVGDLDTHDDTCRRLANATGCLTISVDYRRAPEHPFPAAADDCFSATQWASTQVSNYGGDPARLAVVGDSAGGNLATVVALMARNRGGPALRHQSLIYPVTDVDFDRPSYRSFAHGYLLNRGAMAWYWSVYARSAPDRVNPYCVPMRAASLKGLPPALVITAECDVLRDEGEAYAHRLRADGVPTVCTVYTGVNHGFFGLAPVLAQGRAAIDQVGAELRRWLA